MQDDRQSPDVQEILDRARAALKAGRSDEARQLFAAALSREPSHYTARMGMGLSLMNLGRPREAIEHFRRAVSLSPDSVNALTSLGQAYQALAEDHVAESLFRQAIHRDPSNQTAKAALEALARGRSHVPPAARTSTADTTPRTSDRRAEAEALLTVGAHAARVRAERARSVRAPWIAGGLMLAIAAVYLIVYGGSHLSSRTKGWEHYRAPTGEFELDVPKGWMAKAGHVETAFEWEGVTEAFAPSGVLGPMVRYVVTAVPVNEDVTLDCVAEFAGFLNTRGDVLTSLRRGFYNGPKYPVESRCQTTLAGLPAVEFVLCDGDETPPGPRRVYHTMTIHQGKLYSLHFEGFGKDYHKYIDRIRASAATFHLTTPTGEERLR